MATAGLSDHCSILQVVHSDAGGGVEALASMVANGLGAHGMRVETCYLYPNFTASPLQKLAGVARAVAKIVSTRADVLIAYQSTASVLVGLVGALVGCKKRIVHQTATPGEIHPLSRILDKLAGSLGFYSFNIANSATTEQAFADYPRRYRQHLMRIDHGLAPLEARRSCSEVRNAYAIADTGLLLLTTGRLCPQKAQDRVIRALALIPDAHLMIAGGGPDENVLKAAAEAHGVADRVYFFGMLDRDQIGDLLRAADLFVFPTRWETFGLAAVEAAMAGVGVVANDLPILREVLSTGDAHDRVSFVNAEDPAALAAGINEQRDRAGERDVNEQYRDAIRSKYSFERMIKSYRALVADSPDK